MSQPPNTQFQPYHLTVAERQEVEQEYLSGHCTAVLAEWDSKKGEYNDVLDVQDYSELCDLVARDQNTTPDNVFRCVSGRFDANWDGAKAGSVSQATQNARPAALPKYRLPMQL